MYNYVYVLDHRMFGKTATPSSPGTQSDRSFLFFSFSPYLGCT